MESEMEKRIQKKFELLARELNEDSLKEIEE